MSSARRLALSRLASLTAVSAAYIALISAIYQHTGSALWVSAALFFGVAGSVVGAPAAGWIGDRFERRRVMVGSDLGSAVVAAAMALTIDSALALTLLFGLLAVTQSPFEPASASAMPNLVPEDSLPRANALVAATTSVYSLVRSSADCCSARARRRRSYSRWTRRVSSSRPGSSSQSGGRSGSAGEPGRSPACGPACA
jgi:MFS family permease